MSAWRPPVLACLSFAASRIVINIRWSLALNVRVTSGLGAAWMDTSCISPLPPAPPVAFRTSSRHRASRSIPNPSSHHRAAAKVFCLPRIAAPPLLALFPPSTGKRETFHSTFSSSDDPRTTSCRNDSKRLASYIRPRKLPRRWVRGRVHTCIMIRYEPARSAINSPKNRVSGRS